MNDAAVLARFDGPIVMIGFGSISKGTLPLIERHIAFDRSKFVVIAPDDRNRHLLDERQIRFIHTALTSENYREVLAPLLRVGRCGGGSCLRWWFAGVSRVGCLGGSSRLCPRLHPR